MLKPEDGKLDVSDALAFAGLSEKAWQNATGRGLYEAPKPGGKGRRFTVDDLVGAYVLGWMFERAVSPSFACQIATDVRRILTEQPGVEKVTAWKCFKHDGTPYVVAHPVKPQSDAKELFTFPVGKIRKLAVEGIKQRMIDGTY